jgi:hypothetical protein
MLTRSFSGAKLEDGLYFFEPNSILEASPPIPSIFGLLVPRDIQA